MDLGICVNRLADLGQEHQTHQQWQYQKHRKRDDYFQVLVFFFNSKVKAMFMKWLKMSLSLSTLG